MNKILLIALFFASGFVLLGSFLPWLSFRTDIPLDLPGDYSEMQAFMKQAMTITGWRGNVTLFGITMPNWLVPIAAVLVALTTAGRATGTWDAPRGLSIGLAVFCTVHLGTLLLVSGANLEATRLGFGAILGMFGSLGMLGLTIFLREEEEIEVAFTGAPEHDLSQQRFTPQGLAQPSHPQMPMPEPEMPAPGTGGPNFPQQEPTEAEKLPPTSRVDPFMG